MLEVYAHTLECLALRLVDCKSKGSTHLYMCERHE